MNSEALVEEFGAARIITLLSPLVHDPRQEKLKSVIASRRTDLTVLLERLYDPHNYAAVLRSAEAFGLTEVHAIPGKQGAGYSIEVSQGAQKWIDFRQHEDWNATAAALPDCLFVGADAGGVAPEDLPRDRRLCLVMGAEKPGLSKEARARCGALVGIEMSGFVESFNVSVAAALLLQRLTRARPATPLTPAASEVLFARYLLASVGRAETVLRSALEQRKSHT